MNDPLKPGDILIATNPTALARRIKLVQVTPASFTAHVLEAGPGGNTREPITVFRAGWHLYTRDPHRN
jgi:hypothetical protein